MMGMIDRLSGVELPKLPVHQFWAALTEYADGEITRAQLIAEFGLSAAEEVELDWLIGKYQASTSKANFLHRVHSVFTLSEIDAFGYSDSATVQARIGRIP